MLLSTLAPGAVRITPDVVAPGGTRRRQIAAELQRQGAGVARLQVPRVEIDGRIETGQGRVVAPQLLEGRAQSMDALSSMATIAGYKTVLLAAESLPRMFPMLMTAAGTLKAARVLVVGVGVAGLQAIATARRNMRLWPPDNRGPYRSRSSSICHNASSISRSRRASARFIPLRCAVK